MIVVSLPNPIEGGPLITHFASVLDTGDLGETLADGLQYGVVFNVVRVIGLDLGRDTVERALQRILG